MKDSTFQVWVLSNHVSGVGMKEACFRCGYEG